MERFNGVPVWHASVAKHDVRGLVPVALWRRKDAVWARELLAQVLRGVGLPFHQIEEQTPRSLQARRLASEAERVVIGPVKDTRPGRETP